MPAFISHSFKDEAVYTVLCLALDAAAVERWDPKSMSLGESLSEQLQAAIRSCEVCVLIATRHSIDSSWCLAEVGAFWGAGKKVLMFMADSDLGESLLPPQFKGTLRADDAFKLITSIKSEIEEYHRVEALLHSVPSEEETAIRHFYQGISKGIGGDDAGWEHAWNQCSETLKKGFRNYRPDVPPNASPTMVLKPLYQDSSIHEILHIGEKERVSSSQAVYLVLYKERKEVLVSRLHFQLLESREVTMDEFYGRFAGPQEIYNFILSDIGKYYDLHSDAESYVGLSPDQLKEEIIKELQKASIKRLFGGNVIYELGTFFYLRRKELRKGPYQSDWNLDLYDIGYVLKIHLAIQNGEWKITRFEQNSTFYLDVSR